MSGSLAALAARRTRSGVPEPLMPSAYGPRWQNASDGGGLPLATSEAAAVTEATPSEGWGSYAQFALVAAALLLSSMQGIMVSVALPNLIDDLDAPLRWAGWVFTAYAIGWAVAAPVSGKLSDEVGRWRVFGAGIGVFAVTCAICAVAPNIWTLIAARAVQGFAAGSLQPCAYGIVSDAFPVQKARFMGFISSVFPIGSIAGPNLGGVIVDSLGWRWTFATSVPAAAVLAAATVVAARRERRRPGTVRRPIDFASVALMTVTCVAFVSALTELSRRTGSPSLAVVAVCGGGTLVTAGAFVRRQLRSADPLVDLRLLRVRTFAAASGGAFLWNLCFSAYFQFLPFYTQIAYAFSPGESGLLLTPRAAVTIAMSVVVSVMAPVIGFRRPMFIGLLVMASGIAITSLGASPDSIAGVPVPDLAYLTLVVCIVGVGSGMVSTSVRRWRARGWPSRPSVSPHSPGREARS
jgi:MFS family permease